MKRVLIISYYWPPAGGSGVQRWLKFTKYLPQFGWTPIVYTPSNPDITLEDRTLSDQIHPMTEIVSTKIIEPYSIFRHFIGGNGSKAATSEKNEVNLINANGKKSLKMRISLWIRANVFIPDPKILWVSPSVKFLCKYLEEHPVDLIVSTGPPHSMHLIAEKVSRRCNIKWVADFRDPWTGIFYFKHLPLTKSSLRRYMKMEEGVLRNADAVVTVTDRIATDLTETIKRAGATTPVYKIENGYDESDFCTVEEASPYFTLVHTGLLAEEGDPDRLWKIIGELCREIPSFAEDFRLELVGKTDGSVIDGIFNHLKRESVTIHGYLPHNLANKIQKRATALILPLRKEPEAAGILTGKYFEYLAAGRPIIAFGPKNGSLADSLTATGAGKLFEWDEEEHLKQSLLSLYRSWKEHTPCEFFHPVKSEISKFSRRELTGELAALFEDLCR